MTFYDWMIRNYSGEDSPRGDLAADMERDSDFTSDSPNTKDWIRWHLFFKNACPECIDEFKKCWKEYVRSGVKERG